LLFYSLGSYSVTLAPEFRFGDHKYPPLISWWKVWF
jgi:hypothetical protein